LLTCDDCGRIIGALYATFHDFSPQIDITLSIKEIKKQLLSSTFDDKILTKTISALQSIPKQNIEPEYSQLIEKTIEAFTNHNKRIFWEYCWKLNGLI